MPTMAVKERGADGLVAPARSPWGRRWDVPRRPGRARPMASSTGTAASCGHAGFVGDDRRVRCRFVARSRSPLTLKRMCRNIRTLHNFEPPAPQEEVHDASLQYVRKISGSTKPSQANAEAFELAVAEVTEVTRRLSTRSSRTLPPRTERSRPRSVAPGRRPATRLERLPRRSSPTTFAATARTGTARRRTTSRRGERNWSAESRRWGIWGVPEAEVGMLPRRLAGMDVDRARLRDRLRVRLARPAGRQARSGSTTPRRSSRPRGGFQAEHGLEFPLIHGNAEEVPLPDASFDLAISEYGASIWCDPYKWIPEARRLLRPGGRLVFLVNSTLYMLFVPDEGRRPGRRDAPPPLLRHAPLRMGATTTRSSSTCPTAR